MKKQLPLTFTQKAKRHTCARMMASFVPTTKNRKMAKAPRMWEGVAASCCGVAGSGSGVVASCSGVAASCSVDSKSADASVCD